MKPTTLERAPNADGFIERWLILEPISVVGLSQNALQTRVKQQYFPEQGTLLPHDNDKVTVDGKELTWHAEDTKNYSLNLFQVTRSLGKSTTDVLFCVVTTINTPQEMQYICLATGSNAASVTFARVFLMTAISR